MRKSLALLHLSLIVKASGFNGFQRVPWINTLHKFLNKSLSVVLRKRATGLKPFALLDVPLQGCQCIPQCLRYDQISALSIWFSNYGALLYRRMTADDFLNCHRVNAV